MSETESSADRAGRAYMRHIDPLRRPPRLRLVEAEFIQAEDRPGRADRHAVERRRAAMQAAQRRRMLIHLTGLAVLLAGYLVTAWLLIRLNH